jgi:serine/threonine protein kinase
LSLNVLATDQLVEEGPSLVRQTIAGRYRVERPIGEGGFGSVYLATHAEVESLKLAIKVLHNTYQDDEDMVERFRQEAQLLAMLRNRHTVRLLDFGFTHEQRVYLAMEYVSGTPLDLAIEALGPMRPSDVTRIAIGVLKALVEAHALNIIHRDLKPANIILVQEPGERHPVPRVLDFGIAKFVEAKERVPRLLAEAARQTGAGLVYCTPLYAAPELLRGSPDLRTDLYAVGLVMAELLDGVAPYGLKNVTVKSSPHLARGAVPLGERSARSVLGPIIERAVEKDLKRRYESAGEMLADLENLYDFQFVRNTSEQPLKLPAASESKSNDPPKARMRTAAGAPSMVESQLVVRIPRTELIARVVPPPAAADDEPEYEIVTEADLVTSAPEPASAALPAQSARGASPRSASQEVSDSLAAVFDQKLVTTPTLEKAVTADQPVVSWDSPPRRPEAARLFGMHFVSPPITLKGAIIVFLVIAIPMLFTVWLATTIEHSHP